MLHPAGLEFSEGLLKKRYTPIKPAGQHMTPGVLIKGPVCLLAL